MPFVPEEHRNPDHTPCTVGDQCYVHYKRLLDEWNKEPRWTTFHNQLKKDFGLTDDQTALITAYTIHWLWNIVPYELDKELESGEIE